MNPYMELAMSAELTRLRQKQAAADTSQGMAWVTYQGQTVGLFTVAFAQSWCAGDPAYTWERV